MSTDIDRFLADLTRVCGEMPPGLLLAVSGGPDSMAMLALAHGAGVPGITVATVDHRLRDESVGEAAMVAAQCATLGLPHATLVPDAPIEGASLQAQARAVRYALLAAQARAIGVACIATAHHADDQAETFLMRAARGAGLAGLAGVRARTPIDGIAVVRPLLEWRRAELRAIVRRAELPFIDDPSNHDLRHDRTRFRALLDANEWLDPPRLARSAAALAEADADLRAVAEWLWSTRAQGREDVRLSVEGLPRELRRRLVRRAIGEVRAAHGILRPEWSDAANIESLLDALERGSQATQAGLVASTRGETWRFRVAPPRRAH